MQLKDLNKPMRSECLSLNLGFQRSATGQAAGRFLVVFFGGKDVSGSASLDSRCISVLPLLASRLSTSVRGHIRTGHGPIRGGGVGSDRNRERYRHRNLSHVDHGRGGQI